MHGIQEFTADDTWTAPAGVTDVLLEMWGGGGGGGGECSGDRAGGGGGGAYVRSVAAVTPGDTYKVHVANGVNGGAVCNDGNDGDDSVFFAPTTFGSQSVFAAVLTAGGGKGGPSGRPNLLAGGLGGTVSSSSANNLTSTTNLIVRNGSAGSGCIVTGSQVTPCAPGSWLGGSAYHQPDDLSTGFGGAGGVAVSSNFAVGGNGRGGYILLVW